MKPNFYLYISRYVLLTLLVCSLCQVIAQPSRLVEGTVRDLDGNPVIATIRHGGGARLADKGYFSFELSRLPDTLHFSAVGFETVTRIITQTTSLQVRMSPIVQEIEEVVVHTGYQSLRPNEITGSIDLIDEKAIQS